jgi:hypothetical protein
MATLKVFDAWTDNADYSKAAGRNVYAAHSAPDGLIEVYGFTGNSDDAGLHAFADSTEATDFARTIRERGHIEVVDIDGSWVCVDCVSLRDFVSPGGSPA